MNKMYAEIVVITPEEAQNILNTKNVVNRPINKSMVDRYAASMKAGAWQINGESLIFAPDGTLLDGQNRLAAVVKANVSVPFCVWYNVPETARSCMNIGRKRTAANILHFKGYKNATIMAPIVRMAYIYDVVDHSLNLQKSGHEVNADIIDRYADYLNPDVAESTAIAAGCRYHLKPSVIGLCHLIFSRKNKALADEFIHQLVTGEHLTEGHPVLTLLNKLIGSYSNGKSRLSIRNQIALYIKAWNAFVEDKPLPELSWNFRTEAFPVVA